MDRKGKILQGIDVSKSKGLEIGPLCNPVVKKEDGNIFYLDFLPTAELKSKYQYDTNVCQADIVDIDYAMGEKRIPEIVGPHVKFDYVIASHVIEHVPDMVGWFQEIAEVLRVGGILSLVIPNKNFTFDYERNVSSLGDIMDAYYRKLRKPSYKHVFDHFNLAVSLDAGRAWRDGVDPSALKRMHTINDAMNACEDILKQDRYIDVHCTVFTEDSFAEIINSLQAIKLCNFKIASVIPTQCNEIEFFVQLERC